MQGDVYCVCWTCKKLSILDEDMCVLWLKDHWGHSVLIKEDLGDRNYDSEDLPHEEAEEEGKHGNHQ